MASRACPALGAIYPATTLHARIAHPIHYSLEHAGRKDGKGSAAAIWSIYAAPGVVAELTDFEQGSYGHKYSAFSVSWRRTWAQGIALFAFPSSVCKVIYTTNAIESVNAGLRKNVKPAGDDVAMKPTLPAPCNVGSEWSRAPRGE